MDKFAEEIQFRDGARIPRKLTWRDVEVLTKQSVIDMYERGRWAVFVLQNGVKFHVEKW